MPFTGERLTSALTGQTEIEHLHRYLLAREFCRGKDVVDVASGEGYGSALIGQVSRSVVGVEIAEDAVAHSAASYRGDHISFRQGDARAMPVENGSADVVISFETIEHFAEHAQFLSEIRRVLRPGGRLIVSTPDRDNYSPAESEANPYHVKEMTGAEFVLLLKASFRHVACLAQRPMIGSVILPASWDATGIAPPLCFEKRGAEHFEASEGLARPQYVVAVCSDLALEALPPSIYVETSRLGYLQPQMLEAQLSQARSELAEASQRLAANHQELANFRDAAIADGALRDELAALRTISERQEAECRSLEHANEMAERASALARRQLVEAQEESRRLQQQLESIKERNRRQNREAAEQREADRRYDLALARHERELAELRAFASSQQERGDLIMASTSWRVTAPLRLVGQRLRLGRR